MGIYKCLYKREKFAEKTSDAEQLRLLSPAVGGVSKS